MRELERARFIRAHRSWARRGFVWRVALPLCLLSGVSSLGVLGKHEQRAGAARLEQPALEELFAAAALVSPQASRRKFSKSARSEDGLWRVSRNRNNLILNEKAQRKLLSHAPVENK